MSRAVGPFFLVASFIATPVLAEGPSLTGFTPQVGTVGSLVKIIGANLESVTSVQFNGLESDSVHIISSTHIKVVVPRRATSGPITVAGPNGTSESAFAFLVEPAGGIRLAFSAPRPNPSRGEVAWRFSLSRPGRTCLTVFNLRGARVSRSCLDFAFSGVQELIWDGRDPSKRAVPSGVYFGRLESGGWSETRQVTLVW